MTVPALGTQEAIVTEVRRQMDSMERQHEQALRQRTEELGQRLDDLAQRRCTENAKASLAEARRLAQEALETAERKMKVDFEDRVTRLREELLQPSEHLKEKALRELSARIDGALKSHMTREFTELKRMAEEVLKSLTNTPMTPPLRGRRCQTRPAMLRLHPQLTLRTPTTTCRGSQSSPQRR